MELLGKDETDASKLMFLLRKIIEFKKFDQIFVEKFLTAVSHEFSKRSENLPNISEWLAETFQKWKQKNPSTAEIVFVCKFIGILAQYEQGFLVIQSINTLDELSNIFHLDLLEKSELELVYIRFLSDILNHGPYYNWIKASGQWKIVSHLYFSNSNLYVEREGLNFLKKFIDKAVLDDEISTAVFQEIFSPVMKYNTANLEDKSFNLVVGLLLKLLQSLLRMNILSGNQVLYLKLRDVFDLQAFLKFLLENCKQETIADEAVILQVLVLVVEYKDKKELLSLEDIPVLEIMYDMLRRNQFNGVTRVAKYCQVLWSEMRKEMKCQSRGGVHFVILQLLPALMCIKPFDTALCDLYIQKLFSITTEKVQKFCYFYRDELRSKNSSNLKNLALKSILSVISNTECLILEEAVVIFQTMAYSLKTFIPDEICEAPLINYNKPKREMLCFQDTALLSTVLNALCVFIEEFKIHWPESLESLCLLKITCILLGNADLSPTVVVQLFLLVKLAILNFMSPDLALLTNNIEDSSFDCLMPLLYKHLHDPNWEIRDSCLEVVNAIAELSESKYPAFQQLLVERDLYLFIIDIMEGDSESYVRASAIQALTTMMKIPTLNQNLFKKDIPKKIIRILQNESEGIVRREAALMMKQIYLNLNNPADEIVTLLYEVMGYVTLCDLHWEVKVNSLFFWEAVIQRMIADQGMIDGAFPKVTFSKEHKKIVNLTKDEVKIRLDKVLKKLSEIGCLYILLLSLNDDCDMPVIRKSAEILSDLLTILKRYGVIENCKNLPISDRVPMKRKNMMYDNCEKRKTTDSIVKNCSGGEKTNEKNIGLLTEESVSSDMVIDEIVNEKDINLLVNFCSQKEKDVNLHKKILLEVKPEAFLLQIEDFELDKFLEEKQKWLINVEVDLKSLASETFLIDFIDETNVMDCY